LKNCRQRFWQDPNDDIMLESTTVRQLLAADTARYANGDGHGGGHGRFFFGLERWIMQGQGTDAAPALVSNLRARRDDIEIDQTSLAAPLDGRVESGPIAGDRDLVCLVRPPAGSVGAVPGDRAALRPLQRSQGCAPGAGGFSFAASYNQNHGWILWRLAEHALYTRDRAWFEHMSPALIF
jgi:hypothetical protein